MWLMDAQTQIEPSKKESALGTGTPTPNAKDAQL